MSDHKLFLLSQEIYTRIGDKKRDVFSCTVLWSGAKAAKCSDVGETSFDFQFRRMGGKEPPSCCSDKRRASEGV